MQWYVMRGSRVTSVQELGLLLQWEDQEESGGEGGGRGDRDGEYM